MCKKTNLLRSMVGRFAALLTKKNRVGKQERDKLRRVKKEEKEDA